MKKHMENHMMTQHVTGETYQCGTCGSNFADKKLLQKHEGTHLEKFAHDMFPCHLCPLTFVRRQGLQQHVGVAHENQRNHPCPLCDHRLTTSTDLKRHVATIHPTNTDFVHSCGKCEYQTNSKRYLAQHVKRHGIENRRHECYFCGKKFIRFAHLVSHSCRVHTLEK
ncbi:zinc finger Y-chromosomal protein-like [Folsomia candida]|uniref:zinc finger Y-chromosomal protein-like n=1 Tax=Folsomia candida TaxID=158441 RepID=UPI000B8F2976|nr:zinc finger Y-chromosomal protein-like [Folsomia candida]